MATVWAEMVTWFKNAFPTWCFKFSFFWCLGTAVSHSDEPERTDSEQSLLFLSQSERQTEKRRMEKGQRAWPCVDEYWWGGLGAIQVLEMESV